jgi:hypothetical protein
MDGRPREGMHQMMSDGSFVGGKEPGSGKEGDDEMKMFEEAKQIARSMGIDISNWNKQDLK